MRFRPYPVPEFPTDNHAIHLGASWICLSTTGTPRAVRRPNSHRVQLTPLPAPVAEAPSESRFVTTPRPPSADNVPGPLLSQLWLRLESDLPLSELTFHSTTLEQQRAMQAEQRVEGLAPAELTIIEPEASVPPPVAELLESLPTTPSALFEAEAAIDAELLEVLSALRGFDQADSFSHPTSTVANPLDDLANAIADALCEEFAPQTGAVFSPTMSRAEQRAVAPQLKYPQLAPETPAAEAQERASALGQSAAIPAGAPKNNRTAITQADQFESFVSALSAVAMAAGHSRAAAVLPRLLAGKLVDCSALPDDVIDCLARQNIAHPRGSCVEPSPGFIANSAAWGELLRGQSEDMSACAETLDHFAASLLCALMGESADRQGIRRELRKRGVAAFGMLERAA